MRCEQGKVLATSKEVSANLSQLKEVRTFLLNQILLQKLQANRVDVTEAPREIKMPGYEVMYNSSNEIDY